MIKLLLFADLSPMDDILVLNAGLMLQKLDIEEVAICHYVEIQEVTQDIQQFFKELDEPLDQVLKDELKEMADQHQVPEDKLNFIIHMQGGKDALVDWINSSDYDLCIFGKKYVNIGLGSFASQLIRRIDKPVLFLTEASHFSLDRVLFPTEFSGYSKRAASIINRVKGNKPYELLAVMHVYHVDPVYFPFLAKQSDKMIKKMESHVKKELNTFCKKNFPNLEAEQVAVYAEEKSTSKIIYEYAVTNRIDLVVMGIKGASKDDDMLIGSVADSMIQPDKNIPVLLIR